MKITRKLDKRMKKQNDQMEYGYNQLEEKLKTAKPTLSGKEVKIDKDTFDTLNNFMNTSKRVIKEMPYNEALFEELNYSLKNYRDLKKEKENVQREVYRLQDQNKELRKENNRLHNFIHNIFQVMKKFFRKILKFGNENDKNEVIKEVKGAYEMDVYDNYDLHDIADHTTRQKEIDDYLYDKEYEKDFDIEL